LSLKKAETEIFPNCFSFFGNFAEKKTSYPFKSLLIFVGMGLASLLKNKKLKRR
jgi:hypothetical protein